MATLNYDWQKIGTGSEKNFNNPRAHLELYAKLNSQDVGNNKSSVTVELRLVMSSGYIGNYQSTYWSIGGSLSGSGDLGSGSYYSRTLGSATGDIYHNNDGTKSVSFSGGFNPTAWGITLDVSGSADLPTIPRASQPSVSSASVAMGSAVTINTNRASSSFTHTLEYSFGSSSGTIATGVGGSTSYTPPVSLASQIPNATSGTMTITCKTYNGSTHIGTKTCTLTLTVPSSVKPVVNDNSNTSFKDGNTTVTGKSIGDFVRGLSYGVVAISASGAQGSTISTYSITVDGQTYSRSSVAELNTILKTLLLSVGSNKTISISVTDSRNRTSSSVSRTYNVLAYSDPAITTFSVVRCTSNGTVSDDGTYVKAQIKANISNLNSKNKFTVKLGYKLKTASSYTWLTPYVDQSESTLSVDYTGSNAKIAGGGNINASSTYDIQLYISDSFASNTRTLTLPTGFDLMHFNASGKAVAFGKKSEAGSSTLFEVEMPAEFKNLKGYQFQNGDNTLASWPLYRQTVDLSGLNVDTYYPVVGEGVPYGGLHRIMESVSLNSGTKPSWSSHSAGFSSQIDVLQLVPGWGTNTNRTFLLLDQQGFITSGKAAWYKILTNSSRPVFYLRGGGRYHLFTDWKTEWTICTASTEYSSQTVAPTTTAGSSDGYLITSDPYPVGAIYKSTSDTSPASLFGGTWERIKDRFLLAAGDTYAAGSTGGSTKHKHSTGGHTLTTSEIPSHNHKVTNSTTSYASGSQSGWRCLSWSGTSHDYWDDVWSESTGGGGSHSHGDTGETNHMPPYLTVYVWKRTA